LDIKNAYIYIIIIIIIVITIVVIIINIIIYMYIYISHIPFTPKMFCGKCSMRNAYTPSTGWPLGAPPLVGLVPPAQRAVAVGAFPATATCPVLEARRK
jgi:hypothetical protein